MHFLFQIPANASSTKEKLQISRSSSHELRNGAISFLELWTLNPTQAPVQTT